MEKKVYTTRGGKIADFLIGFFIVGSLLGAALGLLTKSAGADQPLALLLFGSLAFVALAGYLYRKRKFMAIGLFTLLGCQVLAGAIILGVALLAGGGKDKDLSNDPRYAYIVGHVFETTKDMVIVSVGTNSIMLEVPGEGGTPPLVRLPKELPYRDFRGSILLGVMPAGSRFQVKGVRGGWSTLAGGYTSYSLRMKTPKEYSGWILSDIGIISYDIKPKSFKKELVREVVWDTQAQRVPGN